MRGVLFTFDALLAIFIVAAVVPMILAFSTTTENKNEIVFSEADSAIDSLSQLTVRNVIQEPVMRNLYSEGKLTNSDLDKTVMDLIVGLWASNSTENLTMAQNITTQLIGKIVPSNFASSVSIENETLFNENGTMKKIYASSRRIASGYMKGEKSAGYLTSIFLTSIGGKRAQSYYFFGGFVGQGNITAKIKDIPQNSTIYGLYLELNAGENFTLFINNNLCAFLNVSVGNFSVNNWSMNSTACINSVIPNIENNFTINFTDGNTTNEYIGGGYLRVDYTTEQLLENDLNVLHYNFPGVKGLINIYDSFYVPGNITGMNASISLFAPTNYTTTLVLGNVTILNYTGVNQSVTLNISNSTFGQVLASKNITFLNLSGNTIPLRMFISANLTGGNLSGNTDVVLITDTSGSMGYQLDLESDGTIIDDCNNASIYNSTTARISLAKCLDKTFVNAILGGNESSCSTGSAIYGNRVALVSFDTSLNAYENLTTNLSRLTSRINNYSPNGYTCISCAINKAYQILANQSNATREKYIVVMTDGEANRRSTKKCYALNSVSSNISVGGNGATTSRLPPWIEKNINGVSDNLNDVSYLNSTIIKAAADNSKIYSWNNTNWTLDQDLGGSNIVYGIDIFNKTLAFAVGESAKIWKWNGASWSEDADFGNFNFRDVNIFNKTAAFAVGESGSIYKWNGASWSLDIDVGSANLYGIDISSSTLGFAVGSSGKVYKWNGTEWAENTDTGSNTHYAVSILNDTKAFTSSSNGRIYEWNGTAWSNKLVSSYALSGIYAVNKTLAYAVSSDGRADIYEWNGTEWNSTHSPIFYQGNSTTGLDCNDDYSCSLSISESYPSLNANYSAYVAFVNLNNLTVDSIGFGPLGTCTLGNQTITEIAKTGNGTAYSSANATELHNIYCQIASNILTKTTQTQQLVTQGSLGASELYSNSSIEFSYVPSVASASYQEITLQTETETFPGCNGSFFLIPNIKVADALRTSYSGFFWTKNMLLNNSHSGLTNFYNISKYGKIYANLGDPFKVYIPVNLLGYNETNTVINELGLNTTFSSANCSHNDRVIYKSRLRASVPYGKVFPEIKGGIVRIYYDIDHDGISDGFTDVSYGTNLPGFNATVKTVDQLNTTSNALEDALLRLLNDLNYITISSNNGTAGSQTNPIDIKLADVNIDTTTVGGIPYAWGPLGIRLDVTV
jgi:hypothetical protein